MSTEIETRMRATVLLNILDASTQCHITDVLGRHYWDDNGGDTDGTDFLIEEKELPKLTVDAFALNSIVSTDGTYLEGYNAKKHEDKLDAMNVAWTGWQLQGYALIIATPDEVAKALAKKTTVNFTVYRTLEWKSEVDVDDPEDEEELKEAIVAVIPRQSRDFDSQIEEYAELEDGDRIDLL